MRPSAGEFPNPDALRRRGDTEDDGEDRDDERDRKAHGVPTREDHGDLELNRDSG
jgi:hypothetical protein